MIVVAASMLPICKSFICSPPCRRWVPRPLSGGDIQASSFSLYSSLGNQGSEAQCAKPPSLTLFVAFDAVEHGIQGLFSVTVSPT